MAGDLTDLPSSQGSPDKHSAFPWRLLAFLILLASIAVASVLLIGVSSTGATKDMQYYTELRGILDEVRTIRASPTPDFTAVRQRAAKAKQEIATALRKTASTQYPARQSMLWAVRDDLPRMMAEDLQFESESEQQFERNLDDAAVSLQLKKRK